MNAPADESRSSEAAAPSSPAATLPDWIRPATLVLLFAVSGGIIAAGHRYGWPLGVAAGFVGIWFGTIVGGLVGVPVFTPFAVMTVFLSFFEGTVWGGSHYGWSGAVLGGVAGIVLGHVAAMAPFVLFSLVALLAGRFDVRSP